MIFRSLLFIGIITFRYAHAQTIHQCWVAAISDTTGYYGTNYPVIETDTSGNSYIAKSFENALLLAKYDSEGNLLWKASYDSSNSTFKVNQLAIDQFDQVWLIVYQTAISPDKKALILKYDPAGNLLLKKTVDQTTLLSIDFDQSDNVIIGGSHDDAGYLLKIDNSGNQLWTAVTDDESISLVLTDDVGNTLAAGIHSSAGVNDDGFIKKYDPEGNEVWSHYLFFGSSSLPKYMVQDKKGNTYVVCHTVYYYSEELATILLKYDTAGLLKWTREFQFSGFTLTIAGMGIDSLNNIYLNISKPVSTTLKYKMNGHLEWTREIPGGDYYSYNGSRMEADAGGNVYVTRTIYTDDYEPYDSIGIQTYKLTSDSTLEWLKEYEISNHINKSSDIDYDAAGNVYISGISYDSSSLNIITSKYCHECLPAAGGFSFAASNLSVDFTDASAYTTNWFWDFGDGETGASPNPSHDYSLPGIYDVCLIASNDCSADTFCNTVAIIATGAEFSNDGFQCTVFPNPFSGFTTIRFFLVKNTSLTMELLDLYGRKIKTIVRMDSYGVEGNFDEGNHQLQFERENLPPGIYFLLLRSNIITTTQKLIIQ